MAGRCRSPMQGEGQLKNATCHPQFCRMQAWSSPFHRETSRGLAVILNTETVSSREQGVSSSTPRDYRDTSLTWSVLSLNVNGQSIAQSGTLQTFIYIDRLSECQKPCGCDQYKATTSSNMHMQKIIRSFPTPHQRRRRLQDVCPGDMQSMSMLSDHHHRSGPAPHLATRAHVSPMLTRHLASMQRPPKRQLQVLAGGSQECSQDTRSA